jgi:large conductance mechanosensitive channel
MLKGFKEFIARGNVIDLAVGVIIGAAFGGIVDSLVKDIINPVLGLLGGQPDLSAVKLGPLALGSFVNAVITLLLKAAGVYFLIVVPFNRMAARMAPAAALPSPGEAYLKEIRDLLARK